MTNPFETFSRSGDCRESQVFQQPAETKMECVNTVMKKLLFFFFFFFWVENEIRGNLASVNEPMIKIEKPTVEDDDDLLMKADNMKPKASCDKTLEKFITIY